MVLPLRMVGKGFGILKVFFKNPWEMDCLGLDELPMHYKPDIVYGIVGVAQGFFLFS
jgi:hypothetical protein